LEQPNHLENLLQLFHVPTRFKIVGLCDFLHQAFESLFSVAQFFSFGPDAFLKGFDLTDP
jgi:hypothetical protein